MKESTTLGWKVTFAAGTIPLFVGLMLWFCTMWSVANADQPWLNPTGPTGFSYNDVFNHDPKLAGFMSTGFQVGFTNLAATGIFMCSISYFALRHQQRWSWWVLLFAALWIGGNDSSTTVIEFARRGWDPMFMIPLVPTSLTLVGLAIDYRANFKPEVARVAAGAVQSS